MKQHASRRRVAATIAAGLLGLSVTACGPGTTTGERIDRAEQNLAGGEYREAEVRLKQVLQDNRDNGRAWRMLGRASLAQGRYEDAVHQFERARESGEPLDTFALALAQAHLGSGEDAQALEVLESFSPDEDDERLRALVVEGNALSRLERSDEAGAAYARALEIDSGHAPALIGQAELASAAGNDDRARSLLERAVEAQPDYAPARAALARLDYSENQCERAIDGFKKALDQSGPSALHAGQQFQLRTFLADCQLRTDQPEAAAEVVAGLVKAAPDNPYVNYLQAIIDLRFERIDDAASHLQRVLNADPNNVRSLMLMASVKIAQGDSQTAQTYLDRVIARTPDNTDALRMRANIYLRQGEEQKALDSVRSAYEENEDAPGVRSLLAEIMAGLDAETGSADISEGGSDTALQIDLAAALARQGNDAAARAVMQRVTPGTADERARLALVRIGTDLAAGRTAAAVSEAESLVEQSPENTRAYRALARAYVADGQDARAAEALVRAEELAPDDAGVARDQVRLAVQQERYDDAAQRLQALRAASPDDVQLTLDLAGVYAAAGRTEELVSMLTGAHEDKPDELRIAVALTNAYLAAAEPERAVALADELVETHADNADLRRVQGVARLAAEQTDAGLESLARAVELADDGQPAYRFDLAQAQLGAGRVDAAVDTLQALREHAPDFMPAVRLLAATLASQGRTDDALPLVEVLRDNGNPVAASILEGDVRRAAGQNREAAAAYESAFAESPSAELAIGLFEVRRQAGIDAPQRSLEDWSERQPDNTAVALRLGQWYQSNGEDAAAAEQYRQVLDARPDNAIALNNLAVIYQAQDDSRALSVARRAHDAAPDSPAVADTLGWILVQAGQLAEGIELLETATEAPESPAGIRYHLAYALAQRNDAGDEERAIEILRDLGDSKVAFDERDEARQLLEELVGEGTP
ncbi:XrtA/PEP-CTERM system TPR-repeat protein PrsT [Salinisphaera orenii]|uniref:XrtA/PEP-CTERM system TPR-repeat protein PrsT n=1 Tax=Salinisphaera orenii TaxID=856731 RepID=UPI000F4BC414|nr:XrtA/PEP-CTERM system TPR-repeat protein PrsT [Salinisphaera orenii]